MQRKFDHQSVGYFIDAKMMYVWREDDTVKFGLCVWPVFDSMKLSLSQTPFRRSASFIGAVGKCAVEKCRGAHSLALL